METTMAGCKLLLGDAKEWLVRIESESIHLCLTDPPYFLDKLDNSWDPEKIKSTTKNQAIPYLPSGMKFSPGQGKELYSWYFEVSEEIHRVLKPGAFFLSFSSPRLSHRMALAMEDAGFHIRDVFAWIYPQGAAKGFSRKNPDPETGDWRTPMVRANHEHIIVAQKPAKFGLFENFSVNEVGLFNYEARTEVGHSPSNVLQTEYMEDVPYTTFLVSKPSKKERELSGKHPTVKPVELLRHLIRLTTKPGQTVLDPFLGSGTTCVAAILEGRRCIGIEIHKDYLNISLNRINLLLNGEANAMEYPLAPCWGRSC